MGQEDLSEQSVLYLGYLVNDEVESEFDLKDYSLAGSNKKRGIVKSLTSVGADVTVVCPLLVSNNSFNYYHGERIYDEDLDLDLHIPPILDVYGINYLFLGLSTLLLTLKLLYRRQPSSILFYNFQLWNVLGALAGKVLFRTPIILEYEDGLRYSSVTIEKWVARVAKRILDPLLDGAVCVSTELAATVSTSNVAIVRGFPSIGMPEDLPDPNYRSERTVVMFAGSFDSVRGIETFLSVASVVVDQRESLEFWICGYGSEIETDRVETAVQDLDTDRVQYFGTLPWSEYRNRIVSSDILVNFQDPEARISKFTFPSKLLDFMASGNIIVTTDMGDLRSAFDRQLIVDGKTESELVETLVRIEDCGLEKYADYGSRGQQWVSENCTHRKVGEDITSVLRRTSG